MIEYLSNKLKEWNTTGVRFIFAHDPTTDKPSVTLLFPYVSFMLLVISTIGLHFNTNLVIASIFTAMVWIASVIFYLMRKLQKASFSVKTGSVELEAKDK